MYWKVLENLYFYKSNTFFEISDAKLSHLKFMKQTYEILLLKYLRLQFIMLLEIWVAFWASCWEMKKISFGANSFDLVVNWTFFHRLMVNSLEKKIFQGDLNGAISLNSIASFRFPGINFLERKLTSKAHSQVWDNFWQLKALWKWWKMIFISPLNVFSFSRNLSFCADFLVM